MNNCYKKNKETAFSLVELILVVLFIGIFTAIAVPRMSFSALFRKKADTVAMKIVTDLRRTRGLAIANAANYDQGFQLRFEPSPPYSFYEIVESENDVTVDSHTIDSNVMVTCIGNRKFKFGPLGNLKLESGSEIIVEADGHTFTISFVDATGIVECSEN